MTYEKLLTTLTNISTRWFSVLLTDSHGMVWGRLTLYVQSGSYVPVVTMTTEVGLIPVERTYGRSKISFFCLSNLLWSRGKPKMSTVEMGVH